MILLKIVFGTLNKSHNGCLNFRIKLSIWMQTLVCFVRVYRQKNAQKESDSCLIWVCLKFNSREVFLREKELIVRRFAVSWTREKTDFNRVNVKIQCDVFQLFQSLLPLFFKQIKRHKLPMHFFLVTTGS
jgi:hypothetical protein